MDDRVGPGARSPRAARLQREIWIEVDETATPRDVVLKFAGLSTGDRLREIAVSLSDHENRKDPSGESFCLQSNPSNLTDESIVGNAARHCIPLGMLSPRGSGALRR